MTPAKIRFSAIHAVLLLSLCLSLIGIWWGLPSYRGWAPDEILPSRVLEGMDQWFSNNWADKYPPLQYYLLSLLYLPFVLLQKLKVLDLSQISIYTALFSMGRLLSAAMATATVYLVYRCGLEIYDKRSSLFAALITALIVPFVYYSKTVNLDVPFIFWFVWSVFFFFRILKTHAAKSYGLFALTAACSICTKDQAYALYILPPLVILLSRWLEQKKAGRSRAFVSALFNRNNLYALALAVSAFLIIHNLLFNAQGFLNHFRMITGPLSQDYKIYENTLSGHLRLLWATLRQIQFCHGWPLLVVCGFGLIASVLRTKKNLLLLASTAFAFSYYLFYINIILYNYDRFNIPICIVLAFFGGKALSGAMGTAQKFAAGKRAGLFLIFGFSFLYAASVDVMMVKDSRYHIERWMRKNIPSNAVVGVASPLEYVPRLEKFKWFALRPSPGSSQEMRKADFILFNVDYSQSFAENTPGHLFFTQLDRGRGGYALAFHYQTALNWLFLKTDRVLTNIRAINPEIKIFRRIEP